MTDSLREFDITPSPRLLQILGDIPLQPWQCLSELVDNSLDELLRDSSRTLDDPLVIDISVEEDGPDLNLVVADNGLGMDASDLERSLRAGYSAKGRYGSLGLFGMGFNIATARLGSITTVETTQMGSTERLSTTIDFADLQKRESFKTPVRHLRAPKKEQGTTVRVRLKGDMIPLFQRAATHRTLMSQLGDVYSFLLRESVPGITRDAMSARVPALIRFNGEQVEPKLPCVWRDERSVTSYGQEVHAIQYIDRKLAAATACLDCGYWDRKNGPEECEECGSANLDERERRIWGWVGIQRYIDSQNFGIDFLRYGRKILKQDRSIFVYTDPDTLVGVSEYPIEMPANQGRIVGEIHLDHAPVTYQKNDFDRQSRDWQTAIEVIRGKGPLKPQGQAQPNESPLARLFSAYRRNDPGLRYLIPGDGQRAIHNKAREWAGLFDKGVARMQDDSEWYEAARRHEAEKAGTSEKGDGGAARGKKSGKSAIDELVGSDPPSPDGGAEPTSEEAKPKRQGDVLAAARHLGTRRDDLSGTFKLSPGLGTWDVTVVVTRQPLEDATGMPIPAMPGAIQGNAVEVFVHGEHALFTDFGRDVRDVALVQAASLIRDLAGSDLSPASVYGEMVQEVEDLRTSVPVLLERVDRTLDRLRLLTLPVVEADPEGYWDLLSADEKAHIESMSAVQFKQTPLRELVADGRFVLIASAPALAKMVGSRPDAFFDGVVFQPSIEHRRGAARDYLVGAVLRAIAGLAAFKEDEMMRDRHDLQLVQVYLEMLDEQLSSEDVLR